MSMKNFEPAADFHSLALVIPFEDPVVTEGLSEVCYGCRSMFSESLLSLGMRLDSEQTTFRDPKAPHDTDILWYFFVRANHKLAENLRRALWTPRTKIIGLFHCEETEQEWLDDEVYGPARVDPQTMETHVEAIHLSIVRNESLLEQTMQDLASRLIPYHNN